LKVKKVKSRLIGLFAGEEGKGSFEKKKAARVVGIVRKRAIK